MVESDKLYPELLNAQAEEVCKKLMHNSYVLGLLDKNFIQIKFDNILQGETYDAVRRQFDDYALIFNEIKTTNSAMIDDCYTLVNLIGEEIYDGPEIFGQQRQAIRDKEAAEAEAASWRAKITEDTLGIVAWYYEKRAEWCDDDARECQAIYDALEDKKKEFDAIEAATKNLFNSTDERAAQKRYLQSIVRAFSNGTYVFNLTETWRDALRKKYDGTEVAWPESVVDAAKQLGMTDAEIKELKQQGVVLTSEDIELIKNSKGTDDAVFSIDKSAVIYNGKVYYVNVPDNTEGASFDNSWSLVKRKESYRMDWDFFAGFTGLEVESMGESDGYVHDSSGAQLQSRSDVYGPRMFGSNIAFLGMMGLDYLENCENTVYTRMSFETNGTVGRVTILLGDNDKTEQLQNANYYGTSNSYAIQEGIGMEYASDVAGNIYTYITGNDVDDDKEYTIISTLDERHKTGDYQYYMYYDNGNLMAKPIIYSGDTAYVATCDRGTGYNTQKILDFTEYLDSPVYVASNEELLNKAMTNQE